MASDLKFVEYVTDQMRGAGRISHRAMFGEYAVYVGAKVVALVCDNHLFVKPTKAGLALLKKPKEAPPYPGAKPHFLIDAQLDDNELMTALIRATDAELPAPKPKRPKPSTKSSKTK